MNKNNDKLWIIANDDLTFISLFLEKIKTIAISTHCYVDHLFGVSDERTNNVLCMLEVIEDLTDMTDKSLSEIADKLCVICKKKEASK